MIDINKLTANATDKVSTSTIKFMSAGASPAKKYVTAEMENLVNSKAGGSKRVHAKVVSNIEEGIQSIINQVESETTPMASPAKSRKNLDDIDLTLISSIQHEIKSRCEYGRKKAEGERDNLEDFLDNLAENCVKVMDSHIDRLAWKYKPKLALAQEKVDKLEKIVAEKEK